MAFFSTSLVHASCFLKILFIWCFLGPLLCMPLTVPNINILAGQGLFAVFFHLYLLNRNLLHVRTITFHSQLHYVFKPTYQMQAHQTAESVVPGSNPGNGSKCTIAGWGGGGTAAQYSKYDNQCCGASPCTGNLF